MQQSDEFERKMECFKNRGESVQKQFENVMKMYEEWKAHSDKKGESLLGSEIMAYAGRLGEANMVCKWLVG